MSKSQPPTAKLMKHLHIRLPDDLHRLLKELADDKHLSLNGFIVMLLSDEVHELKLAKTASK